MEGAVDRAADALNSFDYVRVVVHNDADGIASGALVCLAAIASGTKYHFRAIDDPLDAPDQGWDGLTVYCDVGASTLDRLEGDNIVIDHHPAGNSPDNILINDVPCSSCGAYMVAERFGVERPELALVGAVGDGAIGEVPEPVLDRCRDASKTVEGSLICGEDPVDALAYSTNPFTELSGNKELAQSFVDDLGISQPLNRLDSGDSRRYASAVLFLAAKNQDVDVDALEGLVGTRYVLDGTDVHSMARYVEATGYAGKPGLALTACLEWKTDDVSREYRYFQSDLIEYLRNTEAGDRVVRIQGFPTGVVADVYSDWMIGRPVLVVDDAGYASLRADSVDCGRVMRECAEEIGGGGGGHSGRAGARVPVDSVDDFVECIRGVIA